MKARRPTWRRRIRLLLTITVVLAAILTGGLLMLDRAITRAPIGGARLETMTRSSHWNPNYEQFVNPLPRQPFQIWAALKKSFKGTEHQRPTQRMPTVSRRASDFADAPASGLRITWLGHSTTLVEIDGARVLLDPVWAERPSPFRWVGPKRFHEPPLPLEELLKIEFDAVAISHDHYDHLDRNTIEALRDHVPLFVVPLGVGAYLEAWGVEPERIIERDWWGEVSVGPLTLVATPARHFSGRSIVMANQDRTLWAGWAILGPNHRVYFSGDSGMFRGFAEIGERLGPFDATLIDAGA